MSSSYPEVSPVRAVRRAARAAAAGCAALAALGASVATAQQTYWQPLLEARVENHTNRNLREGDRERDELAGYRVEAGLEWGRITELAQLRIRPRVRYQDFPDEDKLRNIEQFLDVQSRYRAERSEFGLLGRFSSRDAYTAEIVEAEFDPFDPNDPTVAQTGRVVANNRRTRVQVRPEYAHEITEQSGIAVALNYDRVGYENETRERQRDFHNLTAEATWRRQMTPLSRVAIGPYLNRYETRDGSATSDSAGLLVEVRRDWTERVRGSVELRGERTEAERLEGVFRLDEKFTAWGAMLNLDAAGEVHRWRVSAGRRITPTGSGSRADIDELRIGYDRRFSERLSWRAAARGLRIRRQAEILGRGADRDYGRGELSVRYDLTPRWFIRGGYELTWQDFEIEPGDAINHAAFLAIGFAGLGPQT
jgi:hypothetical protein